ncbi:MAG: RNA 2',3'-cyclic phosphodiesterase [Candidatus Promineifilaceae bacterium]
MKLLRTFIAIELPPEVRTYLFQTGQKMAGNVSNRAVRWVAPENMHLTLRFLGDTPKGKLPDITAELDAITRDFQPIRLHLDEIGCFPNRKRPRVIWAGLAGETQQLNALQHRIEMAVESLGWKGEKRLFRPHLTIGRVKDSSQANRLAWEQQLERKAVAVTAVNLIESLLRPHGPVYTIRHVSSL